MTSITAIRGDTLQLTGRVTTKDPTSGVVSPVDISSAATKIWFTAKDKASDADNSALIRKGTTNTGLSGISIQDDGTETNRGKYTVTVTPAETTFADKVTRFLYYDVQLLESNGRLTTIVIGQLAFPYDVTRAAS